MKKLSILIVALLLNSCFLFSQLAINNDGSPPDPSAGLDVKFTDKGLLIPLLTFEQRNAIVDPATGLMVICTNCSQDGGPVISIFLSGKWQSAVSSCPSPLTPSTGIHIPVVTQITWNWNNVPIITGYKWNTVDDFSTAVDMGTVTTYIETGLTCWTSYTRYVWAYNACGQSSPVSLTQATSQIPFTTAPLSGTHTPGIDQIIWNWNPVSGATGYRWNTTNDISTATDVGTSTSTIETGLQCNKTYTRYIWAYDACGYSTVTTLQQSTLACLLCGAPITDARDGKVYNTVLIDTQCWMAQNLNIGTRIDGTQEQTDNAVIEKYCYNDLESNCNTYGGLYQWNELMQYVTTPGVQGICPAGWHIPSSAEWTTLTTYLGGASIAGGPMKEAGLAHWAAPNTGATNSSGFTALPGGYRNTGSPRFTGLTNSVDFWLSSQSDATNAWIRALYWNASGVASFDADKSYGFSVRCVKD